MSAGFGIPLSRELVLAALEDLGVPACELEVHSVVSSTNDLALAALRAGAPAGRVIAAEHQTSGRGRLSREWVDAPGGSLLFSVCLRPRLAVPLGWLPLGCGLAVADGIASATGVEPVVKWPNDVVIGGDGHHGDPGPRKLAGLLMEMVDPHAVVLGVGINVNLPLEGLPTPQATALNLEGATELDRAAVLAHVLRSISVRMRQLEAPGSAAQLADEYRARCLTLGQVVMVAPAAGGSEGAATESEAIDIDPSGGLIVESAGVRHLVSAGDVVHVRRG